jgi:hypothetical protein
MDERTGLQCEGGNARCIAWSHFERRILHENESAKAARAQFTTEKQPVLRAAVAFSKTSFKHRSIQIKGNFKKLTTLVYYFVPFIVNNRYLLF